MELYNEDCFAGIARLEKGSVDLLCCDPPYEVSYGSGGTINRVKKFRDSLADLTTQHNDMTKGYDIGVFSELVRKLQGNEINAYFFCNKKQIPEYLKVYVGALKCKFDILCWHKQNALPTYANKYLTDTEYILYFHSGKGKTFPKSYEDAKTYYMGYINHSDKKRYRHPTIKPLPLIEKIIRNSSREGDLVLDPFMGSGTTAVACINTKRRFIGFELDKAYYDIAVKRVADHQNTTLQEI